MDYRTRPLLLLILVILVHLLTLLRTPAPFQDEPWAGSRALALLETGIPFGALEEGFKTDHKLQWLTSPYLATALNAVPTAIAGKATLWGLRSVSLAFGLVLLFALYLLGSELVDRPTGILWALATAFSDPFFFAAHVSRPDIGAAALAYLSLALTFKARRGQVKYAAWAGLIFALALDFHPRALMVLPGFLLAFVSRPSALRVQRAQAIAFSLSFGAGLALYALVHILPDPASYFGYAQALYGKSRIPAVAILDLQAALATAVGFFRALWFSYGALVALAMLGAAAICRPATRSNIRNAGMLVLLITSSAVVLVRTPLLINIIVYTPAFDLMVALGVRWVLIETGGLTIARRLYFLAIVAMVMVIHLRAVVGTMAGAWNCMDEATAHAALINSNVSQEKTIIGPLVYWFNRQGSRYIAWEVMPFTARERGLGMKEVLDHLGADVIVIDDQIRPFVLADAQANPWLESIRIDRSEFEPILKNNARLIASAPGACFGKLEIFELR